jgi:aryl-alcohol dehydrogenase-like predicted oxidoreductase
VTRIRLGMNRLTNTREHIAFPKEAVAAGVNHIDIARMQGPSDLMMSRRQRQFLGLAAPTTRSPTKRSTDRSIR